MRRSRRSRRSRHVVVNASWRMRGRGRVVVVVASGRRGECVSWWCGESSTVAVRRE
jgi:hypothetical protein